MTQPTSADPDDLAQSSSLERPGPVLPVEPAGWVLPGHIPAAPQQPAWGASPQPSYAPGAYPQPGYSHQPGAVSHQQGSVVGAVLADGTRMPPQVRVDPIAGTPYGVAFMRAPRTVSGPAIGSLVVGIAAIVTAMITGCFGLLAGVVIAGAFAILTVAVGTGSLVLGGVGLRQVRDSRGQTTGNIMAIAGMACGGCGLLLGTLSMIVALATSSGT